MKPQLQKLTLTLILFISFGFTWLNAQPSEFYGMTPNGGEFNAGTIFKTDGNGNNLSVVLSFPIFQQGSNPHGSLIQADNGKLYGITGVGGVFDAGVLFEWDPATDIYTKKLDFNGAEKGAFPSGSLILANNGKLYGMTYGGGVYDKGVLFEWDPATNTYTKELDFSGTENGRNPYSTLVQADNGKLYGMTSGGGANDRGVLFEWDPATNTYTKKLDFTGAENGSDARGSLMQADNDKLYGMTAAGGENDRGILFEWDLATNTFTKKLDFNGEENGGSPFGSLIQADNGKLYGMTTYGGVNGGADGYGVLFEWDPTKNTYIKKLDFNGSENGSRPCLSLMMEDSGKLYGMTGEGGANNRGVLFEWDPATDTYTKKLDFNETENGTYPGGSLIIANQGKLYGMTLYGGVYDRGVLFEWDPSINTYTKKFDFNSAENGRNPIGSLVRANNGKLYGVTSGGGVYNYFGVLFEFDPATDIYTKKLDFNGAENGGGPNGSLIQADNGKLYGMTIRGGSNNRGVLFEWDPATDTYTKKLDFNGAENGSDPWGYMMQADNGKLYGMTFGGGANDDGVLFEWDPATDTYTKKRDFNLTDDNGFNPIGSLIQADNGKLYGMTIAGGAYEDMNHFGGGVLFEWDPATDTYTKKMVFNGAENGSSPYGSLVQADNGKLYGMTCYGGIYNHIEHTLEVSNGVLFEWNPATDTYTKKLDFNGLENGCNPIAPLMQAANGKLYGITTHGGINDLGVLFEWDPVKDIFTKKLDFTREGIGNNLQSFMMQPDKGKLYGKTDGGGTNGYAEKTAIDGTDGMFFSGSLIEVIYETYGTLNAETCDSYTSPSGNHTWTTSGVYKDTISNIAGYDSIITVNLTIRKADASVTQDLCVLTATAADADYQWIDCDNGNAPIDGETNKIFTANASGNYAVIISDNGCIDTSACFSVIPTGLIENTFKHGITLYPNPNGGSFSIDLGKVYPNAIITITGSDGRIIQREITNNARVIDLKMIVSPGIYMITITSENERAVFRIVKN